MNFQLVEAFKGVRKLGDDFLDRLPYLVIALLVFIAFTFVAKGVRALIRNVARRRKRHQNIGLVLGRLSQGATIFLGLLIALVIAIPSFQPGQLVEFLGLSSVAIGFAFRDILQNFLAGILILWNQPFQIGDQIKMGEYEGNVEEIQTRATTIRTYDGRRIVVPNSSLFSNPVVVNTAYPLRRVEYDFGIGYGDDIEHAKKLILESIRSVDVVVSDPAPEVLVYEFGAGSVDLRARWWINPPRRANIMDSRDKVLTAVKANLLSNGIDLPFPTQQVLFHDQTEETDGDRARQREGWPAGKGEIPKPRCVASAPAAKKDGPERGAS